LSAVVERLPVTLSLSFLSLTITIPVGITLGVLAAYWRNTWLDSLVDDVRRWSVFRCELLAWHPFRHFSLASRSAGFRLRDTLPSRKVSGRGCLR